jgi:hypothetical protein
MPVLCDFIEILGSEGVAIGDGRPPWKETFDTGGREGGKSTAFLIFNVRGLTYADKDVDVKINNKVIGKIVPYGGLNVAERDDTAKYWYTQLIAMNGADLKNGINEIEVLAADLPVPTATNKYDDFSLKNVICFFHQAA